MLQAGLSAFGNYQIDRIGAHKLDVRTGRIEMRIVRDNIALLAGHGEKNALGGAALMGGNDVAVAEDILDGVAEVVEAASARIALIAFHDPGPLARGHGARAGVGEQVDEHVVRRQEKQVVVGGAQQLLALRAGSPGNGLDALDPKRLDDGLGEHSGLPPIRRPQIAAGRQ